MMVKRIIFTGQSTPELETALLDMGKELRLKKVAEVTKEDMEWADTYVGGRLPQDTGFGGVRWVHAWSAGVDFFIKDGGWPEDILLTRTICSFGRMIGEYCLGHLLRYYQKHEFFAELQKNAKWGKRDELPETIRGKRVVIFGTGVIGSEVAGMLSALGMRVDGVSRSGEAKAPFAAVAKTEDSAPLLNQADWVISTMPLTGETERYFNREVFAQMNHAGFINVGRGKTVEEADLLAALDQGRLHSAVLDVAFEEPLPEQSPLWAHPGVIITPHISAVTPPGEGEECFLNTLRLREEGRELLNVVDVSRGY